MDENANSYEINTCNLKMLTGTSYELFNYLPRVMLLGAIQKNKDTIIDHSPIQCIYRNRNLKDFFTFIKKRD